MGGNYAIHQVIFSRQPLRSCATDEEWRGVNCVFILDEYETLFGLLATFNDADPRLRFTVLQPLLDQMVEFSYSNQLVLLGQQPNAHFILTDQNQLSPYVEQDGFPLFRFDEKADNSEFVDLIRKTLTERFQWDHAFASAVYEETSGHPFMTVNLLVEFVDWLIEIRRPRNSLAFKLEDFEDFRARRLTLQAVAESSQYDFFRGVISEATGSRGRQSSPWLFAVYSAIRHISMAYPDQLSCSRSEFREIARLTNLDELGLSDMDILHTAALSNFLGYDDDVVWPKIRLLGRIAQTATPRG